MHSESSIRHWIYWLILSALVTLLSRKPIPLENRTNLDRHTFPVPRHLSMSFRNNRVISRELVIWVLRLIYYIDINVVSIYLTIFFRILSVRLCLLYMLSARRLRSTRSMGAGCDSRTVVFRIRYTRSLAINNMYLEKNSKTCQVLISAHRTPYDSMCMGNLH